MNKKKFGLSLIIIAMILFSLSFYSIYQVNSLVIENIDKVHNSYINDYDISGTKIDQISYKLDEIEKDLTKKEITIKVNNRSYKYTIYEMGVKINKEELKNSILDYEKGLDYWTLYNSYSDNKFVEKKYEYRFILDEEKLDKFLDSLEKRVNIVPKKGNLVMDESRNLIYANEIIGYSLNKEKSKEIIKNNFINNNYEDVLELDGNEEKEEDYYRAIDTKISSFTTTFDDTVSRKYNLISGANHLDGKIVYPHTEFSFFGNAGPYNGSNGYVYYLGVMGNGVCQVATTLYNAELLAGLTTVERYNHGKKSVYVAGGLDATVAVTSGYVTDFRFRNDYDYPVYISAFVNGDKLTVEFWSNSSVKNGLEYKTESVRLGYGAYKAYRHSYKDGQLINSEYLGTSYYFSE